LLVLAIGIVSCARSTPPPSPSATRVPSSPSTNVNSGAGASRDGDVGDPKMEALAAELLRFNPSLWPTPLVARAQVEGVRMPARIATNKDVPPPAKIRAYAWAGSGACASRAPLRPFESDGTPCSGVVASADLSADEMKSVIDLVADMQARMRAGGPIGVVRCDFDPHHALVFLDESDTPIAIVEPCFICHQWRIRPSMRPDVMNDYEPPLMTPEQRLALARIIDAHHLGAWTMDDDDEDRKRTLAYVEQRFGGTSMFHAAQSGTLTERGKRLQAALVAAPPDVDRDAAPKRTSPADRHKLCAWYQTQFEANGLPFHSSGFECKNGRSWQLSLDEGACEKAASACDRSVRDIEACLRAYARGPQEICENGFPRSCEGMQECALGVRKLSDAR
jgi:hypothetical protein